MKLDTAKCDAVKKKIQACPKMGSIGSDLLAILEDVLSGNDTQFVSDFEQLVNDVGNLVDPPAPDCSTSGS